MYNEGDRDVSSGCIRQYDQSTGMMVWRTPRVHRNDLRDICAQDFWPSQDELCVQRPKFSAHAIVHSRSRKG